MIEAGRIVFAAGFTLAVCLALGKSMLKLLHAKLYRSEELFFGFVLGAVCLSTLTLLLGVAGLAYSSVFFAVGCAAIALAWLLRAAAFTAQRLTPLPRPWSVLFAAVYGLFAVLYFVTALQPEASSDGALHHVALPALYLREHRIPGITTNFLASLSAGVEMLYLFAFAFGKHSAAAMVHLLFLLLTPLGMLSYARRFASPAAGVVGSLLFFLSPIAGLLGTTAYRDVAVAAVVFAVFYLLQIWRSEQDSSLLVPLGLAAGFAYAIKYTAFIAFPYAVCAVVFRLWRTRRGIWRPCAMVGFSALAVIAPWIIKNYMVVANPFSPFANREFRNPYLYVSTEESYREGMSSLQGMPASGWLYEVTTRGGRTQGFLGPVFLLSPLALAALWFPAGRQLLIAAAVFLLTYPSAVATRFLLPALPFIALALGMVLSRWTPLAIGIILLHAVSACPAVIPKYANRAAPRLEWPDWRAALRITPEPQYLAKHLIDYDFGLLLDSNMPPHDRAFSFRGFQQAYHSRQVLVEWQSAEGVRLGESLLAAFDPRSEAVERHSLSFDARTVQSIRLTPVMPMNAEQWSINELRVFHAGLELPRTAEWRLRAFPNPWDVQLAFDNSPLTRWASRERATAAMFIEIDFGKPETIDRVTVESTPDQAGAQMALDRIPSKDEVVRVPAPPRLRLAAIENLKAHSVQWLVVHDLDYGAGDFLTRQAQWGIRLIGTSARYRLYRLE